MRRVPEGGLLVALVLAGLSVWMTWPIAAHLGSHVYDPAGISRGRPDWVHPDVYLTTWIVGWVARLLPAAPWRLFDAPIFHPAPDALAYSEHLLGAAPITVPAYWLGGVTFAHQTLLLATFVLSALGAAALVGAWTRSAPAALVAGALYAFAPWRFHELHGVHLECTFYLPLAFVLAQRWLAVGRPSDLAGMTVALAAQALAAYSLAYPTFAAIVPFVVALARGTGAAPRRLGGALGGIAVAAILVAVVSIPYLRVQASDPAPVPVVSTWSPEILQRTQAARLAGYVDPRTATYLGVVSVALAAAGIAVGLRGGRHVAAVAPRPLVAAMLATVLSLVLLSLGPYAEVFGFRPLAWLWNLVPGLGVYRVPLRFGFLVSLPVAVLGGLAAAGLVRTLQRRAGRTTAWLAAGLLVAAVCWQTSRTIPLRRFPPATATPAAYEWLARQPCPRERCAVLELPAGAAWEDDARAVFWTLAHEHPVANGYSGFAPAAYPLVLSLAAQLPEPSAQETLARVTGTRWLLVHRARLTAEEEAAWDAAAMTEAARFDTDVIYEIASDVDWRDRYVAAPADVTFAGTPLEPLPAGGTAAVKLEVSPSVRPRAVLRVAATVVNVGNGTWPSLTSRAPNRVSLSLTWVGRKGRRVTGLPVTTVFLPTDLRPNERLRVATRLVAPAVPGPYAIFARVVQEGVGPLRGTGSAIVRVAP